MNGENNRKSKRGRRRTATGLRKHQQIDGVVVEELFPLFDPSSTEQKVGDGIYVSATTGNNKRFYGVLIDQSSLKEASSLFFQDQSDSLRLNERMNVLNMKRESELTTKKGSDDAATAVAATEQKGDGLSTKRNLEEFSYSNGSTYYNGTTDATESSDQNSLLVPPAKKARLSSKEDTSGNDEKNNISTESQGNRTGIAKAGPLESFLTEERPIQKFKYVEEKEGKSHKIERRGQGDEDNKRNSNSGNSYRILVATFSSIYEAACGDHTKARLIHEACEKGGNFLAGSSNASDSYYYQYEMLPPSLRMDSDAASKLAVIRTSMGFHSFLQGTALPPWYPLSNLYSQSKVLNLLNMKQGSNGKIEWDTTGNASKIITCSSTSNANDVATMGGGTKLPMQTRVQKQYQIGVIGGGIAGLACCQELTTALKNDGIHAKVTLVEARSRLGGRIATDRSWKTEKDKVFPVELGASWIHGIDDNPLATLAQNAGIEFVRASEEVKMVGRGLKEIDSKMDEKTGKLFDDLLDHATEDIWTSAMNEQSVALHKKDGQDPQSAVRWYASCFSQNDANKSRPSGIRLTTTASKTPVHRRSDDRSVDCEIGRVIARHKLREFSKLSAEEHRMLLWNSKNVEYALGSNLDSLSMKYWDVDDRHAFEGDHVLLKEGYSTVIDRMLQSLTTVGPDKFEYFLNFPVGKVEYGRKSATQKYSRDQFGRDRHLTELSDSCSITSEDGSQTKYFDFLVAAVPLGVLKESVERESDVDFGKKMTFIPSLPFSKIDAIRNVGFGLLNKVYVQFPTPFWRIPGFFKEEDDCLFGNVTGVNPHHYMFFDVGKRLGSQDDSPAILMSLVSGKEAVALECLSDDDVIKEVVETLRVMFEEQISIPDPIGFRITRWGKDRFSRGSYTYLPPGSTDQDFQLLQSPVNGNGDSFLLEGNMEVMRLFFAGEHTTALHPSVTHGAMLSGIRAAQEVVSNIQSKSKGDKDIDKVIPISIFRHMNPTIPLQCNLCHKFGWRTREGPLLAFKRGNRQVLVHNSCAEFCPEVEVLNSKWKNVIRAVNRGKTFTCCHCAQNGATIGCSSANCFRMFHFSCAEDTGWRFEQDGKAFFCDSCRVSTVKRCDRISTKFYSMKTNIDLISLACQLCRMPENDMLGELLAFQQQGGMQQKRQVRMCCVHLNCVKHTNIVDTSESQNARMNHEYRNVFEVLDHSKICSSCSNTGASIRCSADNCDQIFHYHCAIGDAGWDFERKGRKKFYCKAHRNITNTKHANGAETSLPRTLAATMHGETGGEEEAATKGNSGNAGGGLAFHHNLFSTFGGTSKSLTHLKTSVPGNLDMSGAVHSPQSQSSPPKIGNSTHKTAATMVDISDDESSYADDDDDSFVLEPEDNGEGLEVVDLPLSQNVSGSTQPIRLERSSREEFWNVSLKVLKTNDGCVVMVASSGNDLPRNDDAFSLQANDIIVSLNGSKVGSRGLETLREILLRLKQEVDLMLEIVRNKR